MTELQLQAQVSKTATFTGSGVDVSAITGDFTLHLRLASLSAGTVRIQIEESVDNFVSTSVLLSQSFVGPFGQSPQLSEIVQTWRKRDFAKTSLVGTASAKLRVVLTQVNGGGTVVYEAWISY